MKYVDGNHVQKYTSNLINLKGSIDAPKSEYMIWISSLKGPASLIGINHKNLCFAELIEAKIDFSKKPTDDGYIIDKAGLTVSVFGQTPNTESSEECGNNAIKNIAPKPLNNYPFNQYIDNPFDELFKQLDRIGFKRGLTYQTLPYNFIKSFQNNELKQIFRPNIERLHKLTGKKVSIIAHSFGNLNTSYQLSRLTQEFKNKHIKDWISVAPPLLGAMTATQSVLGGNDSFNMLKIFGLKYPASSKSLGSFPSMYELMQVNMFTIYQNEPWFKNYIQKRLDYENDPQNIPFEDSGMLFWPKVTENCTPKSFKEIDQKCYSGLEDLRKFPSITVENGKKEYYLEDNEPLIRDWQMLENSLKAFNMFNNEDFRKLRNPGVPVQMIYSKSAKTVSKLDYKNKISDYTKNDEYPKIDIKKSFGDGTVGANSALFPAIKWAYEYNHKSQYPKTDTEFKVIKFIFIILACQIC